VNPHILFVDDDAKLCEILALYFEAKDFTVTTAGSPQAAQELLGKTRFDLAILDVNLNGESGLDLLDFSKTVCPDLPVIMFTGLDVDESLVKQTLRGRAEGIIPKTGSLAGLVSAVRWHLAKSAPSMTN
jgi:DNA-binding response OmpR family regulator